MAEVSVAVGLCVAGMVVECVLSCVNVAPFETVSIRDRLSVTRLVAVTTNESVTISDCVTSCVFEAVTRDVFVRVVVWVLGGVVVAEGEGDRVCGLVTEGRVSEFV